MSCADRWRVSAPVPMKWKYRVSSPLRLFLSTRCVVLYARISLFEKKPHAKPLLLCYFSVVITCCLIGKHFHTRCRLTLQPYKTLQQSSQLTEEPFSTKINIFKWADALNSVHTDATNSVQVLFSLTMNTKQQYFWHFQWRGKGFCSVKTVA